MRFRLLAAAAVVCVCAVAQPGYTVDQVVEFVRSAIRLKQQDKEVAAYLRGMKLKQRLNDRTVEELQGEGAGPKTVAALQSLRDASASLEPPAPKTPAPKPIPIPPPSSEEQARVLAETRENALNYSKSLPDFICTQVTRRFVDPSGMEFWQAADTLTARLSYFEQKEDYKLILINNRVTTQDYRSVGGATSSGEFGSMLRQIFARETQARFEWQRWATLRKRRAHVFAYQVALGTSEYRIEYASGPESRQEVRVGYHGLLYVDRDTNRVMRITLDADNIPPSFPVQQATTILDYDFEDISGHQFLLPLRAEVRMRSGKFLTKNDVEFRMYRKFSTEATITFETPAPLPKDKTSEAPPK